jgi:hypothetical protein
VPDADETDSSTRVCAFKCTWVSVAMSHRVKQEMSPLPKTPASIEPFRY